MALAPRTLFHRLRRGRRRPWVMARSMHTAGHFRSVAHVLERVCCNAVTAGGETVPSCLVAQGTPARWATSLRERLSAASCTSTSTAFMHKLKRFVSARTPPRPWRCSSGTSSSPVRLRRVIRTTVHCRATGVELALLLAMPAAAILFIFECFVVMRGGG